MGSYLTHVYRTVLPWTTLKGTSQGQSGGIEPCTSVLRGSDFCVTRGSIRSTRGLGPTMTARGQIISILIGMQLQTLIIARLDQLLQLGARI
jgi:hypothetical protein